MTCSDSFKVCVFASMHNIVKALWANKLNVKPNKNWTVNKIVPRVAITSKSTQNTANILFNKT